MALEGRTVVFYGSLSFKRAEATAKAKAAGAKTTTSFTAKTDLLIVRPVSLSRKPPAPLSRQAEPKGLAGPG